MGKVSITDSSFYFARVLAKVLCPSQLRGSLSMTLYNSIRLAKMSLSLSGVTMTEVARDHGWYAASGWVTGLSNITVMCGRGHGNVCTAFTGICNHLTGKNGH